MEHTLSAIDPVLQQKYQRLLADLRAKGSLAVAFSGGVDSTFLLAAAKEALGGRLLAVTVRSASIPARECQEADAFCKAQGISHRFVDVDELSIEGFADNPANRCYLCKKALFSEILTLAETEGIKAVAEGSNLDDNGDYRPGLLAIDELGIRSPLRDAHLTKEEIRTLSKAMALPTWDKPSFACLASRFVYGERITLKKLSMVEQAEQYLLDLGFRQLRVRMHGESLARIEVPAEELPSLLTHRIEVSERLHAVGFDYVTMDLQGYRSGSMNETLTEEEKK